ncbi:MAG: hypothetical protein ACRDKY_07140, partial [Solirubrobacteraceae bacterium]
PRASAPPARPAVTTAAVAKPPKLSTLRRAGDVWTISHEQRTLHLNDGRGVRLLALLLARPGTEIHSLDLVAAIDGGEPASGAVGGGGRHIAGRGGLQGGAGPALDAQAKSAYRARIDALGEEISEAEAAGDDDRVRRAQEELGFISRELARSVGIGGRDRQSGSHAERARVNVTRAIRSTLKRIAGYDPALGRALDDAVHTGTFCVYRPDPQRPVRWRIDDGGPRR